jgi:hypothetical protein
VKAFAYFLTVLLIAPAALPIEACTTAHGPARDRILCIVQDSHGSLWFCSAEWLLRGLNLALAEDSRIWQGSDFFGNKMPTQVNILTPPMRRREPSRCKSRPMERPARHFRVAQA